MVKIKITQVRSTIDRPEGQVRTLKALGLGRIGKVAEHTANPQILGMVKQISHLVKVEEA